MRFWQRCLLLSFLCLAAASVRGEEPRRFRTDADGAFTADEQKKLKSKVPGERESVLQWHQPVDGQFPPEGSAHAVSGELIGLDHLNRKFFLRVDRNDSQDRGMWDLAVDATMLPYGAIFYRGSPAALHDIPLGTHLYGQFYRRDRDDPRERPEFGNYRLSPEGAQFNQCFQVEDDVSYHRRLNESWRVESVDLVLKKMVAVLEREGSPVGKPQIFDLLSSTVVYVGQGFGTLASIQSGQKVLFNRTWSTLYGPGRIVEIYLDDASRDLADARQLERHRDYLRERGLPGWIDSVDDEAETVTLTFFGGVDPKLFEELTLAPPPPPPAPGTVPDPAAKPSAPRGGLAVALDSLMMYDPVNDRKGATILAVKQVPIQPGSSGVQIHVKCDMMLEGYRPRRIVRFYPATWKVIALPREEQFFGRE